MEYAHRPVRFRSGTNAYRDPHGDAGRNSNSDSDPLSSVYANTDADSFGNTDSDTRIDTHANGKPRRNGNTNRYTWVHTVHLCRHGSRTYS